MKTDVLHQSFTEEDIRPGHLNLDKEAAYARDVARLLRHKHDFVDVPCPACTASKHRLKWSKWEMTYRQCLECSTVYISPRPTPQMLEEYYTTSEVYDYWRQYIFPASENVRREKIFRPRLERLLELCNRYKILPGTLVEVGPGFGTFCEEAMASRAFKRVIAVEPTPPLAAACRQRGVEVIESVVEHVNFADATANVVAAFEVIEHLYEPFSFLRACYRLLEPRGLLLVTCPNAAGFEVEVLGSTADTVDTEHLNYFNPMSLSKLLGRAGFEVLEVSTPGELDADIVRNKAVAGKFDLGKQRFLEIVLQERWETLRAPFQAFLREHCLSSHMWLAARKPADSVA